MGCGDVELKKFDELTLTELYEILRLRCEIFVVEQDCCYQDLDRKDYDSYHLFLKDNGEIIAYLRIIPENISYREMSIGRVIVSQNHRRKGISRKFMIKAMDIILNDFKKSAIRLSGQAYLSDFYTSLGFGIVSEMYLEDGIDHFEFLYEVDNYEC